MLHTLFLLSVFFVSAQDVRYIDIIVEPPFECPEDYWGPYDYRWVYDLGNYLHIRTKPATVKRFLPFGIGDTITPELAFETERRLRKTNFIAEAKVESFGTDSGETAQVIVQDLWTTELSPTLSYEGSVYEWGIEFEEVNLLGYGIEINGNFRHDEDYDNWRVGLRLPKILPLDSDLSIYYSDATEVIGPNSAGIRINRERRRDSDKYIFKMGVFTSGGEYPIWYDSHVKGPDYKIDDEGQYIGGKYLVTEKFGIGTGFSNLSLKREKIGDYPEAEDYYSRKLRVATAGFSLVDRAYYTETDVDAFGRTEDIPYGVAINLEGGIGPDNMSPYARLKGIVEIPVGPIYGSFSASFIRYSQMESYSASFRFFSDKFLWSRIAGRCFYGTLSGEPPESFYKIDGQTCLRGYQTYTQTGDRTLFGNLEYRLFTPYELFSIRFGACAFFDFGTAWDNSKEYIDLSNIGNEIIGDYGIELRFGSTSSTTGQILRVSVARTFDYTWEFELSSGQLFGTYFDMEHRVPLP